MVVYFEIEFFLSSILLIYFGCCSEREHTIQ